jgi:hypothetical protein
MAKSIVTKPKEKKLKLICGIVMPISSIDGCSENHWTDVFEIISESIEEAGFEPNLVSNADDIGVIQKRIIQNLYDNPIVVCDVSGKNPNVMFELGIRLAFDKPTIIIKDDKTSYSFDTSPIEHIEYPRDLRFNKMVDFKEKLSERIIKTYEKSINDSSYSTFLKHFGEFKIAKIDQKEVSEQEFILDELRSLRMLIYDNNRRSFNPSSDKRVFMPSKEGSKTTLYVCLKNSDALEGETIQKELELNPNIKKANLKQINQNHFHVELTPVEGVEMVSLKKTIQQQIGARHSVLNR